jgi:hypothetical protein
LTSNWAAYLREYRRTPQGRIVQAYTDMRRRISGKKHNSKYYPSSDLLTKSEFYAWARGSNAFAQLYGDWAAEGFPPALTPSIDRVDSEKGYALSNIQWLTVEANTRRANAKRRRAA